MSTRPNHDPNGPYGRWVNWQASGSADTEAGQKSESQRIAELTEAETKGTPAMIKESEAKATEIVDAAFAEVSNTGRSFSRAVTPLITAALDACRGDHAACHKKDESRLRITRALVNATGHESFGAALGWILEQRRRAAAQGEGSKAAEICAEGLTEVATYLCGCTATKACADHGSARLREIEERDISALASLVEVASRYRIEKRVDGQPVRYWSLFSDETRDWSLNRAWAATYTESERVESLRLHVAGEPNGFPEGGSWTELDSAPSIECHECQATLSFHCTPRELAEIAHVASWMMFQGSPLCFSCQNLSETPSDDDARADQRDALGGDD